jgi:hypothetical protein
MTTEEAAKALGMSEVISELYRDMLQSAARVMGSNLILVAHAVRVALAPVEGVVWGYDRIREYRMKFDRLTLLLQALPS